MYIDAQNCLSDAQALTSTATSTNVFDCLADADIARGEPMAMMVTVDTAADFTTGDETYTFAIQDSADNSSFASIYSRAILASALTAGSVHTLHIPQANRRYLQMNYTLAGTSPSVTLTTHVMPVAAIRSTTEYATGYAIS